MIYLNNTYIIFIRYTAHFFTLSIFFNFINFLRRRIILIILIISKVNRAIYCFQLQRIRHFE